MSSTAQDYARIARSLGVTHSLAMCQALIELLRPTVAARIADFGAGSCGDAAYIARATLAHVICIDISAEMLALAPSGVSCVRCDLRAIPIKTGSLDAGYALNLIHLVPDLAGLIREFHRVLKTGAWLALPVTSHDQVRARFINRFFPSLATVELNRFVPPEKLKTLLLEFGFSDVEVKCFELGPVRIDGHILHRLRSGIFSGLDYLSAEERVRGLADLQAFVAQAERSGQWTFENRVRTMVWGTAS
jgi:ubiquinone/menaquinone biosynthesis C-methylase UbiE